MRTSVSLIPLSMIFWSCASAGSDAQRPAGTIDHDKLTGTWQIMTSKNLKTGEVDSTFKRRLLWTQYTRGNWTYIYADSGRSEPTAAEFAKLTELFVRVRRPDL